MNQVKIFALGGLDEDGKNCLVVEVNQDIVVIEAGLKYPDLDMLGIEYIIPDFSYLIENKDRIKGIFITHGHDDVMGALPHLLKQAKIPVYATALTALFIEDLLKEHDVKGAKVHRIRRFGKVDVGGIKVRTFGLTQSVADGVGLAIETPEGYVVYTSEFIIDFDANSDSFRCDITEFAEIGKKGVLALMTESVSADRVGFTSPRHRVAEEIESAFDKEGGRIIIMLYEQNLYRLIEVIELANKHDRKIVFYNEDQRQYLRHVEKLGYYKVPVGLEIPKEKYRNDMDNVLVIVSALGPKVFKLMHKIAISEDAQIELNEDDTVLIASPVVPGSEKEAATMENELYKEGCKVISLDHKKVLSMHGSQEDVKLLINLFKPKYYIPIKGQYRHLVNNANVALKVGYNAGRIVVLDSGQEALFQDGVLKQTSVIRKLEEIMIDGNEKLDISGMVLRDRETLATDGAMIVGVVVNFKTKEVIGGPDVQSRGVIYLKDADYIVKEVGSILENTINELVANNQYDNNTARMTARDRIQKYISKETGKRPMILTVVVEINIQD
ncbi:MAG TPA: RNase J family beta-CASP ribonuclease [Erysipelotrichaceae bacterium]|nr:RNase J family beta-CASP ribonuclease [Erysipelotrichaceae bacterium]